MSHPISILTANFPHELMVAKSKLESEGVECFLENENVVQVYNFYSNAIGGVKLLVWEEDYQRAETILKEAGFLKEEDPNRFNAAEVSDVLVEKTGEVLDGFSDKSSSRLKYVAFFVFMVLVVIIALAANYVQR